MAAHTPMEILERHQAELRNAGVKSLKLFGSVVRGEARPESDIDILVLQHRRDAYATCL